LGVEVSDRNDPLPTSTIHNEQFSLVSVGRLCAVKNHAFLVAACAQLRDRGVKFKCSIAGEGPERRRLERLIRKWGLELQVSLSGHVPHSEIDSLYDGCDVVVLTSHSEGIPLVLMEAMGRGKIVLAPAITGIPELVVPGQTGFLYQPGSLDGFVNCLLHIHSLIQARNHPHLHPRLIFAARQLDWMRHAARAQILHNFNRKKNLEAFAENFIPRIAAQTESHTHENFVLQQI
jgi:glycosyltransferase involved in cell wall biosynthesis